MGTCRTKTLQLTLVIWSMLSVTSQTVDVCSPSFPGGAICDCTMTSYSLTYDCRARNIDNIPRGYQNSATTLNLSNNKIRSLYVGPLNNLRNLTELYLQANLIHTIQAGSLDGLMKLRQLILTSNQLTTVERGFFRHLPSLEVLDLSNNKISTINRYAFFTLPSAYLISLENNPLECGCEEYLLHEFIETRKSLLTVNNDPCGSLTSQQGAFSPCDSGQTLFTPSTSCYQCSGAASFQDCGNQGIRNCTRTNEVDSRVTR